MINGNDYSENLPTMCGVDNGMKDNMTLALRDALHKAIAANSAARENIDHVELQVEVETITVPKKYIINLYTK